MERRTVVLSEVWTTAVEDGRLRVRRVGCGDDDDGDNYCATAGAYCLFFPSGCPSPWSSCTCLSRLQTRVLLAVGLLQERALLLVSTDHWSSPHPLRSVSFGVACLDGPLIWTDRCSSSPHPLRSASFGVACLDGPLVSTVGSSSPLRSFVACSCVRFLRERRGLLVCTATSDA